MSGLFEETTLNALSLKNRFIRAATWEGLAAADGAVTPELIEQMAILARGGVGLIISSHAYVSREGQGTPRQLGVYKDELVAGLARMTAAVHAAGGKICLQLAHAGQFAPEELTGQAALAVSASENSDSRNIRPADQTDIRQLVDSFARGAQRAMDAGFDGIEIHAAHGYFLSQFLSPAYNRRSDEFGRSLENRTSIHLEIYKAVRAVVGTRYPVLIKMNGADFIENGLTLEDSLPAARRFAEAGFDAIEVSGGIIRTGKLAPSRPGITSAANEGYFSDYAHRFRQAIDIPIILVGGVRSIEVAEQLITDGIADYISLSRPLIREPGLIERWCKGDRRRSACKSDNLCLASGLEGRGVYCVTRELEEKKAVQPG